MFLLYDSVAGVSLYKRLNSNLHGLNQGFPKRAVSLSWGEILASRGATTGKAAKVNG